MVEIELCLDKSVEQNASIYFEQAKKLRKKMQGAKGAIAVHQKKLIELEKKKNLEKEEYTKGKEKKVESKHEWYEKFRWFISSEDFLVVGGRDATTNEIIIKKHTDKNDMVFHTDIAGSPFFVIKRGDKEIGLETIKEVADATVTFSRVFQLGHSNSPVFWVKPEQVTKEAPTGEYLTKGAFMIKGKTNYIDNKISLAIGKLSDGRLMAGPVDAVKKHCSEYLELIQGDNKISQIAKKIKAKLGGEIDDIIRILPTGGMEISKS